MTELPTERDRVEWGRGGRLPILPATGAAGPRCRLRGRSGGGCAVDARSHCCTVPQEPQKFTADFVARGVVHTSVWISPVLHSAAYVPLTPRRCRRPPPDYARPFDPVRSRP